MNITQAKIIIGGIDTNCIIFFSTIVLFYFMKILIVIPIPSLNVFRLLRHSSQNNLFLMKKKVFRLVLNYRFFLGHAKKLVRTSLFRIEGFMAAV